MIPWGARRREIETRMYESDCPFPCCSSCCCTGGSCSDCCCPLPPPLPLLLLLLLLCRRGGALPDAALVDLVALLGIGHDGLGQHRQHLLLVLRGFVCDSCGVFMIRIQRI